MVLFDLNSSNLSKKETHTIEAVAEKARSMDFKKHILLVGRTDKVGDAKHNKHLSKNRAMAVKEALIQRGVPSDIISVKAAGETPGPKVDAHNRRVDVIFLEY
jgi:outer membrane protein OmpA-like peptidoglycan-associated protein